MTIETGLLFGAIACALGLAGFFGGRQSAAKSDGVWKGQLDTNVEHIKDDLKEIKATMSVTKISTDEAIERVRVDYKDSVRRAHDRLDDHLRNEHSMAVPQRHG